MKINIDSFTGISPRISAPLLPNGAGQVASNVKLTSGSLKPINSPSEPFSGQVMTTAARSLYILGDSSTGVYGTNYVALSFAGDVDFAPSPVSDALYRVYMTDGVAPKKTSLPMAITDTAPYDLSASSSWYNLGVPGPAWLPPISTATAGSTTGTITFSAAHGLTTGDSIKLAGFVPSGWNGVFTVTVTNTTTVTITFASTVASATTIGDSTKLTTLSAAAPSAGGSIPDGTYVYVYTYVTQFGALLEESAPSAPVTVSTAVSGSNRTIALTNIANPLPLGNYNYVYKRIYRTTGTLFQLVAQIPSTQTTYTDTLSATQILGDSMVPNAYWTPPPSDLVGILTLPNGALCGFRNNEIWFSEPWYPHAWPINYMQTVESPIVGIKNYGNTIVAGTQSFPFVGNGVHPDSYTFQKLPFLEPCLSKRGMASDEFGVLYPSANGIVAVGNEANGVISANYVSRDTFAQYAPDTFTAAVFERRYYGFYDSATYGTGCFVFSRGESSPVVTLTQSVSAVTVEKKTARMLFIGKADSKCYQYDPLGGLPQTYTWKSKLFQSPQPVNMGCFRIVGQEISPDDSASAAALAAANAAIQASNTTAFATLTATGAGGAPTGAVDTLGGSELGAGYVLGLNGSTLQPLLPAITQTVNATIYAGKVAIYSGAFAFNQVYRLPSGFKNIGWEIQISGQREVLAVQMALSPQELQNG